MIQSKRGLVALTAVVLASASLARASTIVSWDFNGQSLTSDGSSDTQTQTITPVGLTNATPNGTAGAAFNTTGAGSVAGIGGNSGSTTDYYFRAGIGTGATTATSNEGGSIQWSADLLGYTGVTVTFAADNSSATSGAFTTETLQYNDGITGFQTAAAVALTQAFVTTTVNISNLDALINNDPLASFRIVYSGSSAYTGTGGPNARVDNLAVLGTPLVAAAPEPASLGLIGLTAAGLIRRRRSV